VAKRNICCALPRSFDFNYVQRGERRNHYPRWVPSRLYFCLDKRYQWLPGIEQRPYRSLHHLLLCAHGLHAIELLLHVAQLLVKLPCDHLLPPVLRLPRYVIGKLSLFYRNIPHRICSSSLDLMASYSATRVSHRFASPTTTQMIFTTQDMWVPASCWC